MYLDRILINVNIERVDSEKEVGEEILIRSVKEEEYQGMFFLREELVLRGQRECFVFLVYGYVAFECKSDFRFNKKKIIDDFENYSFNVVEKVGVRLQRVDE